MATWLALTQSSLFAYVGYIVQWLAGYGGSIYFVHIDHVGYDAAISTMYNH